MRTAIEDTNKNQVLLDTKMRGQIPEKELQCDSSRFM